MRYYLEIKKSDNGYEGCLHKGNPAAGILIPDLDLGPDAETVIKGVTYKLEELIHNLVNRARESLHFDERWQLELGQYLYSQLFKGVAELKRGYQDEWVDLRIITQDEHITRLPWSLLSNNGIFLSTTSWAVSLSTAAQCLDYELPPSPQILIVAPQPSNLTDTKAETHIEELEYLLSGSDRRLSIGGNIKVVRSWEEFKSALSASNPHIIYFYGHGAGNLDSSQLVFESGEDGKALNKPIADVTNILQTIPKEPPFLIYLNCCLGDAGGILGAGRQLGNFIPAVITNYTYARISAAQAQGLAVWRGILIDGQPPHVAVAEMRRNLGSLELSFADLRWMTPVHHCHYGVWRFNRPAPAHQLERDSHWQFKLDRVKQFSQVAYQVTQMLRERKPRSLAYIWYGQQGQGIDLFHQRLKVELQEYLTSTYIYEVQPEWPLEFSNPYRSFQDMFTEAFGVQSLHDVLARIRTHSRGISGKQTLIYIRHRSILSSRPFNLKIFKKYLEWWDCNFVPLLGNQNFALLGVSFVVGKPPVFLRALVEKEHVSDLELDGTVIQILDEMDKLAKRDLIDFLKTHDIRLPRKRQDRLLEKILEETNGNYEMTLEALKDIAQRAWDIDEEMGDTKPTDDNYEYD